MMIPTLFLLILVLSSAPFMCCYIDILDCDGKIFDCTCEILINSQDSAENFDSIDFFEFCSEALMQLFPYWHVKYFDSSFDFDFFRRFQRFIRFIHLNLQCVLRWFQILIPYNCNWWICRCVILSSVNRFQNLRFLSSVPHRNQSVVIFIPHIITVIIQYCS